MVIIRPLFVVLFTQEDGTAVPKSDIWDRLVIKSQNGMIGNISALEYVREYFKKHVIASPFYTHLILSIDYDPDLTEQQKIYDKFFNPDNSLWTAVTFDTYYTNRDNDKTVFMLRQDFIVKGYVSLRSIADLDTELGYSRMARKYVENPYFKAKLHEFRSKGLPNMLHAERTALSADDNDRKNIAKLVKAEQQKIAQGRRPQPHLGRTLSGKPQRLSKLVLQERRKQREESQHVTLVPKGIDLAGWRPQSYVTDMPVREFKVRRIGPKHKQELEIVL